MAQQAGFQPAELGLQGKRVLLTVGRVDSRERYKGHDRVIPAISDLVAKGHDICYLVVGEGDDRGRGPHDGAGSVKGVSAGHGAAYP